jgi:hypothetical protein
MRRALLVLLTIVFWCVTRSDAAACQELPGNIHVTPVLQPVVVSLLEMSPTFSLQCARIAALPTVRVTVGLMAKNEESCCRARTEFRRYPSGVLFALVEIPSPRSQAEYAELLGHEFEHIVEQLELLEAKSGTTELNRATRSRSGIYETERAQWVGKAVAEEAERSLVGQL